MLAFVISLDDVVISLLVAGPGETTLPLYIIGQLRRGVTPEMNAVSTIFLGVSALLVTLFFLLGREQEVGTQALTITSTCKMGEKHEMETD